MNAYLNFVERFAKSILLALVAITVFFIYEIGYITEDSNPYLIPETHPARASILEMREDFTGTYDSVLVALYNEQSIFNKDSLNAIFEITQEARKLTFVDESDEQRLTGLKTKYANYAPLVNIIDQVLEGGLTQSDARVVRSFVEDGDADKRMSSTDFKYLRVVAERMDPIRELAGMSATENVVLEDGTLKANIPVNSLNLSPEKIRKNVLGNELMDMGVVDKDGKVGLVVVEISVLQDDSMGQLRAYEAFSQLVDDYRKKNPGLTDDIYIGGVPVFFAEQKKIMDADLGSLLPLVLLLVTLILVAFFRKALGVVIPLVNVIMCTIWTLGMMAITGTPLDLITSTLPVFLITICSSDAIHVMAEYYMQKKRQVENKIAWRETIRLMSSPVILTTLTTCVTFVISTATGISNLRNFGIFLSVGMFVAMIISLLLIPAWLSLLKNKPVKDNATIKKPEDYFISRMLVSVFSKIIENRRAFIAGFVVFMAGAAYTASQVKVDDMGSAYFAEGNTFRVADDFINNHVAGTSPGWIEIDTQTEGGAVTLDTVQFVDKLEKFIHEQENVSFSYSIARYVRRINYVLNDNQEAYNRLPNEVEVFVEQDPDTGETFEVEVSGDDISRQAILMFENGGGSDLTNVLNSDFSKTVLLFTMNTTVASEYQQFLDKLNPWLATNTPNAYKVKLGGSPTIWTAVLDELLSAQKLSLLLAFFCVIGVMSAWLGSIKMGLAGTLPLAATVILYFALMTILGIELNIGTAIISFLVLGIVDYSVHFLLRIKVELKEGHELDKALLVALTHSGRSIVANVFVFSIGFIALLFSSFKPIVDLGALVGISLFLSGILSLVVIVLFAPWLVGDNSEKNAEPSLNAGLAKHS